MKKIMRKKYLGLACLGLAMALGFTGCGDANFNLITTKNVVENDGNVKINYNLGELIKLGKFKGIDLTKPADPNIDEAQVIGRAAGQANTFKNYDKDSNTAIKNGDIVNINFAGYVNGAKKPTKNTVGKNYWLGIGSNSFIPGFENQLVGHKIGSKFDINLTFPKDYGAKNMAGKPVRFAIKVNGIVNDNTVAKNTKFKTITEWFDSIKKSMAEEQEKSAKNQLKNDALSEVLKYVQVRRMPDQLVKKYEHDIIEYVYKPYAQMQGKKLEDLKAEMGITDEQIKQNAQQSVMSDMAVVAIAKKENIKVSMKEYNERKEASIGEGKTFKNEEDFVKNGGADTLIMNILRDKVEDFIVANAHLVKAQSKDTNNQSTDSSK